MVSVSLEAAIRTVPACSRRAARKLRRATLRLLVKTPAAAGWIALLDNIEWEHRRHVLGWVLSCENPPVLTDALRTALLLALEEYPACFWRQSEFPALVAAVGRGVRLEAIEAWSWLRGTGEVYVSLRTCPGPSFSLSLAVVRSLVREWDWGTRDVLLGAWNLCGESPRFTSLLLESGFLALPPFVKSWLIEVCAGNTCGIAVLRQLAGMSEADLAGLVSYSSGIRAEFVVTLRESEATGLLALWPKLRAGERTGLGLAIEIVRDMTANCRAAVAVAPATVFARIGKARRNRQMWCETTTSLRLLGGDFESLLCSALTAKPELLFACGERMAAFGNVRSRRLLRSLVRHPLFAPMASLTMGPDALVAFDRLLCAHRELAQAVPAFPAWDRHFSGEKILGCRAIEEVGAQMLDGLTAMRLRYLMYRIDEELALFGDAHAGLLRAGLRTGRQPLTRFLREFARGRDTRLTHAANRQWLAKRPDFPLDAWLRPLRITLPVTGLGDVTLSVEEDPSELLRVGTYARTCLAAGAFNSANAVAVLLDVNKRVVFARNTNGRFLARQIVAISEEGRLVCHAVYPEKTATALEDFFQLYVEDWAMQMRLVIALSSNEDSVAPLTVARWYNDGLWRRYCVSSQE